MYKPIYTIGKLQKGEKVTIVALGDSLTYGWMVERGYLDYFYEFLNKEYPSSTVAIVNKGIPGDTAYGGLQRVSSDVIPYKPDCVIVQFALNDYACGYSPKIFGNYISAIIKSIKDALVCDIVLLTSVWFGDFPEAHRAYTLYDVMISIAHENKLPVAKAHEYWKNVIKQGTSLKDLVQFDGIHPTEKGYYVMSLALQDLFK